MDTTAKTRVNDSDLISVPEDFEAGDFIYIDLSLDNVLLGRVISSTDSELKVKKPSGELEIFTTYSDPPLSYVMRNIGKPPNLFDLQPGVIVSRLSIDFNGDSSREYAKVISYQCGRGIMPYLIEIEFLDDKTNPPEILSYTTKYQSPIDEQMRYWTVEG